MTWTPPGKDCGACGVASCDDFVKAVKKKNKANEDCTFYSPEPLGPTDKTSYSGTDVTGAKYDFIIRAFPGEPSARKFVVPFRADLVEKWDIQKGHLVLGRPAGPGCPIYHALRVLSANPITGVIECHTVGPLEARKEQGPVHDVQAYHVHAFEGIAETVLRPPTLGLRQRFLPGYCMIDLSHTALVNMVLKKKDGVHVRVEDIRIL
ncbi:MAG: Fe-S cluster protein [Methanoregula sp.]|uniref:(Fe-S)-binding protein n=1 Tax=Methanoregula sp. TaxID=2052170 RepID=UPI0025F46595|nr:(Fe-S)-binding protein [Methanoregula sp.]MCK9632770.1 Fe-S cluster protein [Methanoregula sp.]